jgi:hypothetical protein
MTKFITTPDRRANLVKLARFLYTEPIEAENFRMTCYDSNGSDCAVAIEPKCGTAGCAIGWAPRAGVMPLKHETWGNFADRALGDDPDFWLWCFAFDWFPRDNTPRGAAKRILWALVKGVPDTRDTVQMQAGKSPLIYADWQPTESDWHLAAQEPA